MSEQEIIIKLNDIFEAINGEKLPTEQLKPSIRLKEDLGINSIGLIYFVVGIEETFGIKMDNVSFNTFATLGDVINFIKENL